MVTPGLPLGCLEWFATVLDARLRAIRAPPPAPRHHPDPWHAKYASLLPVRQLILDAKFTLKRNLS